MERRLKPVSIRLTCLTPDEIKRCLSRPATRSGNQARKYTQSQPAQVKDQSVQTESAFQVVKALQDYIHYCCDQCEYKSKEGSEFKTHLDDNHNEVKDDITDFGGFDDNYDDFQAEDEPLKEDPLEEKVDVDSYEIKQEARCLKCELFFEDESKLIDHIITNHDFVDIWDTFTCKEYVSESCHFSCTDISELKDHVKNHFNSATKVQESKTSIFACLKCDLKLDKLKHIDDIYDHIQESHPQTDSKYACKDYIDVSCPWTASLDDQESFRDHIGDHFKEEVPLAQTKKKKAKTKQPLEEKKKKSVKKQVLKCVKCPSITFNQTEDFLTHLESEHLNIENNQEIIACQDLFDYEKGCDFSTEDVKLLVEHITVHTKCKPKSRRKHQWKYDGLKFFCKDCDANFTCASLAVHLKSGTHAKQSEFKCTDHFQNSNIPSYHCAKIFLISSDLIKHVKESHVDLHIKELIFKCDKCNAIFDKALKLQRHNKHKHLGIPKSKSGKRKVGGPNATCKICNKTFYSKSTLDSHIIAVHDKIKPYVCEKCGKGFTRPALLTQHTKKVHDKVICRTCEFCGQEFNFLDSYKRHIEAKHTEGFAFQCEQCPYSTKTRHNLRMHRERTHATELKFACDIKGCNQVFTASSFLKNHKKKHKKESKIYDPIKYPFTCPQCPQRFMLHRARQQHLKITHKTEADKKCPCCERLLNSGIALNRHLSLTHPHYDKYFCDMCQEKFYCAARLKKHKNNVHGDNNVKCDLCGSSFFNSSTFKQHMIRTHHDDSYRMKPRRKSDLDQSNSIECHLCGRRIHVNSVPLHMIRVHKDESFRKSPKVTTGTPNPVVKEVVHTGQDPLSLQEYYNTFQR